MAFNRRTILRVILPAVIVVTVFLPWWRFSLGGLGGLGTVSFSLWDIITDPFAPGFLDVITLSLPAIALVVAAVTAAVFGYQEKAQAERVRFVTGLLAVYLYIRFILESSGSVFAIGGLLAAVIGVVLILEKIRPDVVDRIPFPEGDATPPNE